MVAEADRKPLRIFMQDGRNDNRRPGNPNGDWFYQNIRLMKALTAKGYEPGASATTARNKAAPSSPK